MAALLLGASAFYLVVWRDAPYPAGDTTSYLEVVRDLQDYRLEALPLRALGYPFFLRLLGTESEDATPPVILQLALHMACVLMVSWLLHKLEISTKLILAFATVGVLPPYTQMTSFILSETLCEFLLVAGIVLLVRWLAGEADVVGIALASVSLAACALTRPIFQLLPFVLAAGLLLMLGLGKLRPKRRRILVAAVVLPIATLLLVGGVGLRNQSRFGARSSPLLSYALAARMAKYIESADHNRADVKEILVRHRDNALISTRHHRDEGYIFQAFPELVEAYGGDEREAARELTRLNLSAALHEPRNYLREVMYSLPRFWEPHSTHISGTQSPVVAALWFFEQVAVSAAFWVLLVLVTSIGLWSRSLSQPQWQRLADSVASVDFRHGLAFSVVVTTILYNMTLSVTVGVGVPRYRAPTDLLILLAIILGCHGLRAVHRGLRIGLSDPANGDSPAPGARG